MARLIIILALVAGFIMLYKSLFGANPRLEDSADASEMVRGSKLRGICAKKSGYCPVGARQGTLLLQ